MHFSPRCRFALLAGAIVNGSILEPKRSPRRANSTKQLGGSQDDGPFFDNLIDPQPLLLRENHTFWREGPRVRFSFPPAGSLVRTWLSEANPIDDPRGISPRQPQRHFRRPRDQGRDVEPSTPTSPRSIAPAPWASLRLQRSSSARGSGLLPIP